MFHPKGPTFFELARQALSSTERGYDLLAPKFDFTPFRTPDWLLAATAPHIGAPQSIDSALDVCCGTGAAMRMLRPLCRRRVVGIDMSRQMLAVARRQLGGAAGEASCELVHGNVLDMPFENQFDVAVCFGALGHILPSDEPRFVQQIARALKPGGRFVFVTATMPPFWSHRYIASRLFNAAMHVRNFLVKPPFIMYYLTFLLPQAKGLLQSNGFTVEVQSGVYDKPFGHLVLVVATL